MLDYYFCQECQTFHQPNRVINGEILTACQCSISTEPSLDQINGNSRKKFGKSIQFSPQKQNTIHVPSDQYQGGIRFPASKIDPSVSNFRTLPDSGRRVQNMPFINIIDEENRERMKRIVMSPQSRQTNLPVFKSPPKIREQFIIRKSVSPQPPPLPRSQRKIITTSPIKRIITHAPTIQRLIPIQQIKPNVVVMKRPIQTAANLPYPPKIQTRINTLLSEPHSMDQFRPPSIRVIEPEVSNKEIKIQPRNQNRLSLDRVSGERYAEEYQDDDLYKQQRVVLDRVSANENVVFQTNEKENCCGQLCYH